MKGERAKMPLTMDPKYWRDRAAEVRAIAVRVDDPESRNMLAEIAHRYDRLAERAIKLLVVRAANKNA